MAMESKLLIYTATNQTAAPGVMLEKCYEFKIINAGATDIKFLYQGFDVPLAVGQTMQFIAPPQALFKCVELAFNLTGVNTKVIVLGTVCK